MHRTAILSVILWTALGASGSVMSAESQNASAPLKCESGPITKTIGNTQWLVYGCADGRSVVIVSAPGSPAMPFYFTVFPGQRGYEVVGEGAGRKEATAAAYSELKSLTEVQMKALVAEVGRSQK